MAQTTRVVKQAEPKLKTFTLHWGSGVVAEEVKAMSRYHGPAIQLLEFREGEAAGALQIRFCYYDYQGRFQRSPLIVDEENLAALAPGAEKRPASAGDAKRMLA
jgi:hypothetical protein